MKKRYHKKGIKRTKAPRARFQKFRGLYGKSYHNYPKGVNKPRNEAPEGSYDLHLGVRKIGENEDGMKRYGITLVGEGKGREKRKSGNLKTLKQVYILLGEFERDKIALWLPPNREDFPNHMRYRLERDVDKHNELVDNPSKPELRYGKMVGEVWVG